MELSKRGVLYIYIYIYIYIYTHTHTHTHTHPNQGMGAGTHLFHTYKQLCYLCLWIMAVEVTLMEQDGAHGHQTVPDSIGISFWALLERAFLGGLGPVFRGPCAFCSPSLSFGTLLSGGFEG